jgi:Na+/phosphate symporter
MVTVVAADRREGTPVPVRAERHRAVLGRVVWILIGLGLFVSALGIMKSGAQSLYSTLQGSAFTDNSWSTLGMGWLGACLVLSGSPVAASSLTFLGGGVIDRSQAFTMLTGSRLGASFVVLVVGFIYALRRKGSGRKAPVSIGILSLTMTVFAYLPGALLGWLLLRGGAFDGLTLNAPPSLLSLTDTAFGWLADLIKHFVPDWGLFPAGLAVLLIAFKAFDRALPDLSAERLEGRGAAWFRKPWAMFGLGCVVALMTMSVSVALTILVPLVAKGHLKRDEVLPYIAGANITTLADTLVAAMLVSNPDAARVVLAEMVGVTAWTLGLIGFMYPTVRQAALRIARTVLATRTRLAVSIAALFTVPLLLVVV